MDATTIIFYFFVIQYMNFKKILEKASAAIAIISIASAFFVGYGVGLSSFKYYIILAIIFGTVAYIFTKDEETSGHHLFNSFSISAMLCIIFFVLLFLGNCLGSCTKGGGDTRQQRIEMGLSPY